MLPLNNTVSPHYPAIVPSKNLALFVGRLAHIVFAVSALLALQPVAKASEVYVRLWGATGPYDPAIIAPSGTVSKILNRDSSPAAWSWRNYAAASIGGLAISAREGLSGYSSALVHQAVSSIAHWQDDVTINSPGLTGQPGVMTITYRVNGYVIFTGTYSQTFSYNSSRLSSVVQMNGSDVDVSSYEISDVGVYGSDFMNADRTIELGFTFGTPFILKHRMTANTAMDSRNAAPGRAEVEAIGIWKGITVKYQNAPMTNFTASSSTVPVWSQPIPRPLPPLTRTVQTNELVFSWPEQGACDLLASPDLVSWRVSTASNTVSGMIKTVRVPMSQPYEYFHLQPVP